LIMRSWGVIGCNMGADGNRCHEASYESCGSEGVDRGGKQALAQPSIDTA
jgi:hypothetical protein